MGAYVYREKNECSKIHQSRQLHKHKRQESGDIHKQTQGKNELKQGRVSTIQSSSISQTYYEGKEIGYGREGLGGLVVHQFQSSSSSSSRSDFCSWLLGFFVGEGWTALVVAGVAVLVGTRTSPRLLLADEGLMSPISRRSSSMRVPDKEDGEVDIEVSAESGESEATKGLPEREIEDFVALRVCEEVDEGAGVEGVGEPMAAKNDWETSEMRSEARFWDFEKLGNQQGVSKSLVEVSIARETTHVSAF